MNLNRAQFKIGPTPAEAAAADSLPFALTPTERTQAAIASAHIERMRRERNQQDDARDLAGVLWLGEGE